MNKLISGITITVFGILLSFSGCSSKKTSEQNAQSEEKAAVSVEVLKASKGSLEDYIEFGGTVEATDSVAVLPVTAGKIARIQVEIGDTVKKNDVIAQVDPSKPGADFALSPVRAPASGTVISFIPSVGSYVTTSTTLAEIASTDKLEIKINVSERFVPEIRLGQIGEVSFKAFADETFPAKITKISPVLDPSTRTMQVTLSIGDTKDKIKAGMFAHVKIITKTKNEIITLPGNSVLHNAGEDFVYRVSENKGIFKAEKVVVRKGLSVDGFCEIEGISENDSIVVKGQTMISDGQKVNVVNE